jgi:hypothetical protein
VYKSPYSKVRLGKNFDGGYIVCDSYGDYDFFLSGGIGGDISFEGDLLNKYPNLTGVAFDGTVDSKEFESYHPRLQIVQKNIGSNENEHSTNFSTYFDKYNDIFMKMDIEGGEVDFFSTLSDNNLLKIKQLVIEIHSADEVNIPSRLAKTHWLIHFHANNCCGTREVNGVIIPNVYECTYIRKQDLNSIPGFNTTRIPDVNLDQRNVEHNAEIEITWPPFVHS